MAVTATGTYRSERDCCTAQNSRASGPKQCESLSSRSSALVRPTPAQRAAEYRNQTAHDVMLAVLAVTPQAATCILTDLCGVVFQNADSLL